MVSYCQENELRYFNTCIHQTTAVDLLVTLTIGAFLGILRWYLNLKFYSINNRLFVNLVSRNKLLLARFRKYFRFSQWWHPKKWQNEKIQYWQRSFLRTCKELTTRARQRAGQPGPEIFDTEENLICNPEFGEFGPFFKLKCKKTWSIFGFSPGPGSRSATRNPAPIPGFFKFSIPRPVRKNPFLCWALLTTFNEHFDVFLIGFFFCKNESYKISIVFS